MYCAKHREYQLVAKSTVPCFLTRVIFTVSVFPLWYAPAVPPELGAQRKFWGWWGGHAKKIIKKNFSGVLAVTHQWRSQGQWGQLPP